MKHSNGAQRKQCPSKYYRPQPPFRIIEGAGTEPFNRLSPVAVWILLRLHSKFDGQKTNLYNLSLTYGEVKGVMSNLIFSRSMWENIGFGFVDVRRFGALERNCSLYGLSNRWRALQDPQKCDRVGAILEKIKILQRERSVSQKRAKLAVLRDELLAVGKQ